MTDEIAASAETRPVFVLSCDIVGWTSLADHLGDLQDYRDILSIYRSVVNSIFHRFDVQDIEEVGDEMRAYFGTKNSRESDASRAVDAALEIVETLDETRFPQNYPLKVRIGIASAMALVEREDPEGSNRLSIAVGGALNLAARLQDVVQPGGVLVCKATLPFVEQRFAYQKLDGLTLQGFADHAHAFQISGKRDDGDLHLNYGNVPETPLVGRDKQLAELKSAWTDVCGGKSSMFLLTGEAGIGKSRLVKELISFAGIDLSLVINLLFSEDRSNVPLDPIIKRLSWQLGISKHSKDEDFLPALREMAGDLDEDDFNQLARTILPGASETLQNLPSTLEERQKRLFGVFGTLLLNRIGAEPAIILVDDLHWADPTSIKLFEFLTPIVAKQSVMVLITSRDEKEQLRAQFGDVDFLDQFTSQRLQLLNRENLSAIVKHAGGSGLSEEAVGLAVRESSGNPYFAQELGKQLRQNSSDLPYTLNHQLVSQMDRSTPDHVTVLKNASVLGREFDDGLLRDITDKAIPVDMILEDLVNLREIELVYETESENIYRFRHALMRKSAYGRLTRDDKVRLHSLAAESLENDLDTRNLVQLAQHLSGANDFLGAARILRRSIQQALQQQRIDNATNRLKSLTTCMHSISDSAVSTYYRAYMSICYGKIFIMTLGSGDPETLAIWQRAMDQAVDARRNDLFFEAAAGLYAGQILSGDLERAHETAMIVGARTQTQPDSSHESEAVPDDISHQSQLIIAEAIAQRMKGTILFLKGQINEANDLFRSTLDQLDQQESLLERSGYDEVMEQRTTLLAYYSVGLAVSGKMSEALKAASRATSGDVDAGYGHGRCFAMSFRAGVHLLEANYAEAKSYAEETLSFAGDRGFPTFFAMCLTQLNNALAHTSDPKTALENIGVALHRFNDGNTKVFVGYVRSLLVEALLKCRLFDHALPQIEAAIDAQTSTGEAWNLAELHRMKGVILQNQGNSEAAIDCFKQSCVIAKEHDTWLWFARSVHDLAEMSSVEPDMIHEALVHLDSGASSEAEKLQSHLLN